MKSTMMPLFHLVLGELTVIVFLNEVGRKVRQMFQKGHRQMFQEGSPTRSYRYHWIIWISLDYADTIGLYGCLGKQFYTAPLSRHLQSNTEYTQRSKNYYE